MKMTSSYSLSRGADQAAVGFTRKVASLAGVGAALLLAAAVPCRADDAPAPETGNPPSSCPVADYFCNWFSRVSRIQSEQPSFVTPLFTVTPRLEEELRYDQMWESLANGHALTSFGGGGGKGVELIPFEPVEFIIGIPSWQRKDGSTRKDGWTDESFLVKYRLLSANQDDGNYILTAFMGVTVPNGSDNTTSRHFTYSPTIAYGQGWGDFDFQSTLGISVPDNGTVPGGAGTPLAFNTAFQYHVMKYLWPEVEANYTYYPNGEHGELNQLFLTPGLLVGRIPISGRVGLTFGVGCQFAVTENPVYRRNVILTARMPF